MSTMAPASVCLSEWEKLQMIIIWDVIVDMAALAMIVVWIPIGEPRLWQAEKRVFVWLAGSSDPYGCC